MSMCEILICVIEALIQSLSVSFIIFKQIKHNKAKNKLIFFVLLSLYGKKLKTMLFPYFMGLSKILGTILGTNIL